MRKSEKMPVFVFPAGPEQAGLQHLASGSEASGFVSLMVSFLDCAKFQLLQGPELWMTSSSFPSLKKTLPPQALKIPLGLGTQPPFQQLLTRAVAGPGASQNLEEKEAVWWKPAHMWVSLKCPVHRKNKNLPFLCYELSAQP